MRAFIAIETSAAIKEKIQTVIDKCRGIQNTGVRYSTWEQLHLTLHFLGEIPDASTTPLIDALGETVFDTESITVTQSGAFPDLFFPKVAWFGVERTPGLLQIYAQIETVLAKVGFAPEKRSFKPHITFARFKKEANPKLIAYLKSIRKTAWGTFTPREFYLYKSELRSEGSLYSKIARFNLRSAS